MLEIISRCCLVLWRRLSNPLAILLAAAGGIGLALYAPDVAVRFKPAATTYIALIKMCVLPILIGAIVTSMHRLFSSSSAGGVIRRLVIVFTCGAFAASALALCVNLWLAPAAQMDAATRNDLAQRFMQAEESGTITEQNGLLVLLDSMVADNVFSALASGRNLALIVIALWLGITLARVMGRHGGSLVQLADDMYQTFNAMLGYILSLLPIGIFCQLAYQIAELGTDVLSSLVSLLLTLYTAFTAIIVVCVGLIMLRTRTGPITAISCLTRPFMVAFVTSSSIAAIPVAFAGLDRLGLSPAMNRLLVPLGTVLHRLSYIALFTVVAAFIADLLDRPLDLGDMLLLIFAASLTGTAAAGGPAVIASMIGAILLPLGLTPEFGITLIICMAPLLDPICSATNLMASCAASAVINQEPIDDEPELDFATAAISGIYTNRSAVITENGWREQAPLALDEADELDDFEPLPDQSLKQ
jgi:proton glutamate symport protein